MSARSARGDRQARETLIASMGPLARSIARDYARGSDHLADLEQVASIGVINAVDRFDPGRGVRLVSYAFPTVAGEVRRHLRDTAWGVHVPRELRELARRLPTVERDLAAALHRAPIDREVADAVGCTPERVSDARLALNGYRSGSTDDGAVRVDRSALGAEDERLRQTDERLTLDAAIRALGPQEREAVSLRFDDDLTQRQIGDRMGCSQVQVSRMLAAALDAMREEMAPE